MKMTKVLAVVAVAGLSSAAYAGNPEAVGVVDDDITIIAPTPAGSSAGSLGGAAPALLGLLVIGAVIAGSGS